MGIRAAQRAVGSVNFIARDFNHGFLIKALLQSSIGTTHIVMYYFKFKTENMSRSYGTQKKFVRFFGGLKSAATKLTEPTALWAALNIHLCRKYSTLETAVVQYLYFNRQ